MLILSMIPQQLYHYVFIYEDNERDSRVTVYCHKHCQWHNVSRCQRAVGTYANWRKLGIRVPPGQSLGSWIKSKSSPSGARENIGAADSEKVPSDIAYDEYGKPAK